MYRGRHRPDAQAAWLLGDQMTENDPEDRGDNHWLGALVLTSVGLILVCSALSFFAGAGLF